MDTHSRSILILSETMPLGGTTTFAFNLSAGLRDRGARDGMLWRAKVASLRELHPFAAAMAAGGHEVVAPDASCLLHEERIEHVYRACSEMRASCVVAALSSGSFDFLRYVPKGCLRVGMIQSDDECVYDLVESYLSWIDIVVGVSREICRKMESRLKGKRIPVVHQPYGVPMTGEPVRPAPAKPLRVLYLGRVSEEQKRIGLMCRVMKRTLAESSDLEWTIAGDGSDLPAMREAFANEPRVRFLGNVPYAQVPGVFPEQDVYFLCSDYEGLPLSLLESMGAGLVPVVSDLPSGISEVVNDGNGIRVPIHDEDGYIAGVLRLAKERELLAAMSLQARAEVRESHSTEAMARRWVEMLESHLPATAPEWKPACQATAPKELDGKWQFSPPMRPVRRLLKRMFK